MQEEVKSQPQPTQTVDTSALYNSPSELEKVLFSLTQADNVALKKATIIMTDFLSKPESVMPLLQQLDQSQKDEVRQMAAVYLREQFETFWAKIPKEVQTKAKQFLINKLRSDHRGERLAIASCIATVAKFELINNEWDSLLEELSKMCQLSPNSPQNNTNNNNVPTKLNDLREIAVTIWRNVIQFCGGALKKHFGRILQILEQILNNESSEKQSLKTSVEAVKAIGYMVEFLENNNEIAAIENVIPKMVHVIQKSLNAGDEENVLAGMEVFNDLAESKIPILNKHSKELVNFNHSIAIAKGKVPMTVRKQAVNFITWMVNSKPKTVIKQNFLTQFIQLGINLVLESANDKNDESNKKQDSNSNSNSNDASNNDNNDISDEKDESTQFNTPLAMGCDLLDEIFKCLPGETVFPLAIKAIESLMNQNSDSARQAAYTVIAMSVEGCSEMISKGNNLQILLDTSLKGSENSNFMIRKTALEAITQLATHMQSKVVNHHRQVLPILFKVFDRDGEDIRVIERALNAIEMFIDAYTDSDEQERGDFKMSIYAPRIMQIVEKCLKSNVKELRVQSLTTIASVASASEEEFSPYLDATLRLLEQCLTTNDDILLRAEATSCIGSVALAVGKDAFSPHFNKFHEMIMQSLNDADDSSLRENTFIYFSEICKLMKEDLTDSESFEDMLLAVLWVMADDDGVQVKLPDDGFGGNANLPGISMEDEEGQRLIDMALEETKLEDLQNMNEEELEELLKKTMLNADKNTLNAANEDDNDDNDNDDESEDDDDSEDSHTKRISDSVGQLKTVKISVRTGFMEEKAAAIHALTQFIRYGGTTMLENMETCFENLLRLWDYPHQLVKMALINCFHAFFESMVKYVLKNEMDNGNPSNYACLDDDGETLKYAWKCGDLTLKDKYDENVSVFFSEMFPLYIQAMIDEEDSDTLNILIDNFIEELRVLGPASIDDSMKDLVSAIKQFLNGKTALLQTGDDPNDEETQNIVTKHKYVSDAIAELIATMFTLWGEQALPIWDELFDSLIKYGGPKKHPHDQAMVVGCIADVCSELSKLDKKGLMSKYSDKCYQLALRNAQETDVNMRQNALYCVGALFTACNQQSNLQHSNNCLRCLQVYMKFPKDGTRQEQLVRDNAISALGKVIISESEALPVKQLLIAFLDSLPLTADFSENQYVYQALMKLVLQEPELAKPHINRILTLLSDALPSEDVDGVTTKKIINFLKTICADPSIQQIVKSLPNDKQENIVKALKSQ